MIKALALFIIVLGTACLAANIPRDNNIQFPVFRQDDGEEEVEAATVPGPSFGPQVAQIITGALQGNLNSILQGSFNLVPNIEVKNNINGAWGTIAGITTPTPTTAATTQPPTPAPTAKAVVVTAAPVTTTTPVEEEFEPEVTTVKPAVGNEDDDDESETDEDNDNLNLAFDLSKVLRIK